MAGKFKRWIEKFPDLGDVIKRFPVTVAIMCLFTIIAITLTLEIWDFDEQIGRGMIGLVIAAYISFCITIAREVHGKSPGYLLQMGLAALITVLAFFSETLRINLVMASGAILLVLGNVILWRKARNDLKVWDFTHKIWTGAAFAVLGSGIFIAGVMIIQETLKNLFGVRINDLTEHFLLPIGLGLLAPLYWLATIPPVDEPYDDLSDNPGFVSKAIAFLGTWLLSPLTLIYALILLAYGIKIALSGELPKGEIAMMTTPFLLVGTLTWLLLEPPFINQRFLSKLFRKFWFPVSLPAAILLAISVWVRVQEYGLTPQRIALGCCVLWALGLGLWFIVGPKAKRDIRLIPGSAAIILLIGTFVADRVSLSSQINRFEARIVEAVALENQGFIIPASNRVSALKAKGALQYLNKHNGLARVKPVLAKLGLSDAQMESRATIEKALSLNTLPSARNIQASTQVERYHRQAPIDISGFDKFMGPYSFHTNDQRRKVIDIEEYKLSSKEGVLTVTHLPTGAEQITDINVWMQTLYEAGFDAEASPPILNVFSTDSDRLRFVAERMNATFELGENFEHGPVQSWGLTVYVLMDN